MDKPPNEDKIEAVPSTSASQPDCPNSKNKTNKNRGKKRKRISSGSSSEDEMILGDNTLAMERSLHASAAKNKLDDSSVRKILKKVVTNDHVLALVQLREEEEDSGPEDKDVIPKLTRSKVKELKKASPKSAAWNLNNLELTPIKHIPVKTRPEVKALIAQELPEDEDDDEYEPTHDDVPSDDDHVLESSDMDSQPRTPATPSSVQDSPVVVKDGPFKVPQDISKARRKLEIEEATIALRTRSKLSLSSTSIEHIESNFVPPDDIPMADVDDLWNEFLSECMNPEEWKNEEDDETDPEYNVAADTDALEEDEEALGRSIIKISKKELNDLVTELFNIMPEATDEALAENLANSVFTDTSQTEVTHWEGKQETLSDDEIDMVSGQRKSTRFSIGKSEPPDIETEMENNSHLVETHSEVIKVENINKTPMLTILPVQLTPPPSVKEKYSISKMTQPTHVPISPKPKKHRTVRNSGNEKSNQPMMTITPLQMSIEEGDSPDKSEDEPPPSLRKQIQTEKSTYEIYISDSVHISQEHRSILQQQLRMHIQLATQNFLQLFVHPIHWSFGPTYKEYLTSLTNMCENNPNSIVDVCNLKPAVELVNTWEESVSSDTPKNREMIEFVKNEVDRSRRRFQNNSMYVGEFHETFQKVVSNSSVFLYPYLLPSVPYRGDPNRRVHYLHSEDELIVLGIDQFWQYVENNPQIYKRPKTLNPRKRWGLSVSIELVVKHMLPWHTTKGLHNHISLMRKSGDKHNPIYKYFKFKEMNQVQHKLIPFNPNMTLYEQPEHELPRIWLRYLAKTSKRFKKYLNRRHHMTGRQPEGVPILGSTEPVKRPLPIEFTKQITCGHRTAIPKQIPPEKYDLDITTKTSDIVVQNLTQTSSLKVQNLEISPISTTSTLIVQNLYRLVETTTGAFLLPLVTSTVNSTHTVTTPMEVRSSVESNITSKSVIHCTCCVLLRSISKKQKLITDYFSNKKSSQKCHCSNVKVMKVTNRLKLLVNSFKDSGEVIKDLLSDKLNGVADSDNKYSKVDFALVTSYQLKLLNLTPNKVIKNRCTNYFSDFNIELEDPVLLGSQLKKLFEGQVKELYLDFLVFLTGEQADKLGSFREYFVRSCVEDLVRKVEEHVTNKDAQHRILSQLKHLITENSSNACQMCTSLLHIMKEHPKLAEYTFGLFPHKKEQTEIIIPVIQIGQIEKTQEELQSKMLPDTVPEDDDSNQEMVVDENGDADESSSGEEDEEPPDYEITIEENELVPPAIKKEPSPDPIGSPSTSNNSIENSSMTIVFEEESIKQEAEVEWKRDEDKIILEILKQQLTPEERRGKPLAQLLEEMKVYDVIAEMLPQKSKTEIEERISYLLSLLMLSENC